MSPSRVASLTNSDILQALLLNATHLTSLLLHKAQQMKLHYLHANSHLFPRIPLRRLKLHGQNVPKTASPRHSEKIVLLGDPKTQEPKIQQKAINWSIFLHFQENGLPGKKFISLKMHYFFRKTTTLCFLYHLCFPMKIPMSFQSFRKPVFENHVEHSTTRSIF